MRRKAKFEASMAAFLDITGLNPGDVHTQLGGDTSKGTGSGSTAAAVFPLFVRISREQMLLIEEHYEKETLISTANDLKSDHNLGIGGFEIRFAGTKVIEDERFHHNESVNRLLEHARRWKDMFGFVIVQDCSTRLEQEVRDIVGEATRDADDPDAEKYLRPQVAAASAAINTTLPIVNQEAKLTAMASKYMHRASDALGLSDVRDTLLSNVDRYNDYMRVVIEASVASSTQPNFGATLPNITIGSSSDSPLPASVRTQNDNDDGDLSVVDSVLAQRDVKRQSFDQLFAKIRNLKPVDFRDGDIYLRINLLTNDRDMVFCPRSRTRDGTYMKYDDEDIALKEMRLPKAAVIDDTVKIYSWPGLLPTDEGRLRTKMYDAIALRWKLADADHRLVQADHSNVKPTVFLTYQDKLTLGDMRELSEQEMLNIARDPTAKDQRADRLEAVSDFVTSVALDVLNGKRNDELGRGIVNGTRMPTGEDDRRRYNYDSASTYTEVKLGRGYSTGAIVSGKTIDDVESRKAEYQQHIAGMVGIPLIQLLGGQGSSRTSKPGATQGGSAAVTGGSAELSGGLFRQTLTKDRSDLALFWQDITEIFFRDMTNSELARVMSETSKESQLLKKKQEVLMATIQEQYLLVTEALRAVKLSQRDDSLRMMSALVTQFQRISEAAMRVSSLNHRFTIHFLKETFLDYSEIEHLERIGAITAFKAANMARAKMGLEAMTEEEYETNRKKKLADTHEEVDANQPTPQPDFPENAKKKRKKSK